MIITKRLEFDAGHRILGHEGKCRFLHGHRYAAEITVKANKLDSIGRVVDFGVIKDKVGSWIDEHWDHNTILNNNDPILMNYFYPYSATERKPYLLENNPTAENMAAYLFGICQGILGVHKPGEPPIFRLLNVRIYETPTCWADYSDDQT